ncbi:DnaJ domain-containing protein [uncultured Abiotrophia sp.]|uniref:J domain-containing protein n=1 Tax=uncultured Abiotrophia sp. TaxID=316094 RepID=UPI0028D709FC|nr:DnaJ domain-containing protein [uncultured Abiotrophia sp.]
MAKTPWQVLGLSGPTADKKAIKRAYAQQVKLYHPEEHPEEFQALQAAYQEALKRATDLAAQESGGVGADFAGGRPAASAPRPDSQPSDAGDQSASSGPSATSKGSHQPAHASEQSKAKPSAQQPSQSADQKPSQSAGQKPGQSPGPSGQTKSQWQAPKQTEPSSETSLDWSDANQGPEDSTSSQSLSWSAPQDQEPVSQAHLSWQDQPEDSRQSGSLNWQDQPEDSRQSGSLNWQDLAEEGRQTGSLNWQDQAEEGRQSGSLNWQDQAEDSRQSGSLNWDDSQSDSSLGDLDELEADDPIFSELEEPEQGLFRQEELEQEPEPADYQPSMDFNLDYQVDIQQLLAPLRGFLDDQDLEDLLTNQALMAQIRQHGQKEALDRALTRLVLTQNRHKRKRVKQLAQQYGLTHLLKKSKQGFRLPYWPMWRLGLAGLAFLLAAIFGRFTGSGPSHPIPPRKPAVDVGKLAVISYDPISIPSFILDLSGLDQMGESGRLEGPEGNQTLLIGEEERLTGIKQSWSVTRTATLYQTQSGYALHLRAKDKLIDFKDYQAMRQVKAFNDQGTQKPALVGQDKSSQQWYLVDLSSGQVLAAISGTAPEQGDTSMGVHYSQQGDLVKAKWERLPQ